MRPSIAICILTIGLISCLDNKVNEVNIVTKIDVFETPEENEKLGNDLISYNYANQLKEKFPLVDLKNVTYQSFRQSTNDEVTFRLILSNTALVYSKELTTFFDTIIKQKIKEHKDHNELIKQAIVKAPLYFRLIDNKNIDSLWNFTSPDMQKLITKGEFYKVLEQRDTLFLPKGERKINIRQYYNSLLLGTSSLPGDFYVLNYIYNDGLSEQITLQGDSLELVGYRFYIPTK